MSGAWLPCRNDPSGGLTDAECLACHGGKCLDTSSATGDEFVDYRPPSSSSSLGPGSSQPRSSMSLVNEAAEERQLLQDLGEDEFLEQLAQSRRE